MKENKYDIKQSAKFLTRMTMIPDMDAGKTEFLEKAYSFLKLNDNNKILEKEKSGMKLAENISNHIYENIIDIVIEEIYENDSTEAFALFIDYYKKRFPNMASAIGYSTDRNLFWKYMYDLHDSNDGARVSCTMLYFLIYGKNMEVQREFVSYLKECWDDPEPKIYLSFKKEKLEKVFGIKSLESNRQYDKFLSEQRKKITDYLDIKYGDLEKYILKYASPGITSCSIAERHKFFYTVKIFQNIILEHSISVKGVMLQEEKKCIDIIKRHFETICNIMIATSYCKLKGENKGTELRDVISATSLEDPQSFLMHLVASFYYELLVIQLKRFMEKECRNFSIDQPENDCHVQELEAENSLMKDEIKSLNERLKQQEEECHAIKKRHEKESKQEIHEYKDKIRSLDRQLAEQKKINKRLQEKISEKTCYVYNFKESSNATENNCKTDIGKMDISRISDKKILFLGGNTGLVNKLKQKFTNACFVDKKSALFPDKVDLTVILTKNISHSLIRRFQSSNRTSPVINCDSTNIDNITYQIMEALKHSDKTPAAI